MFLCAPSIMVTCAATAPPPCLSSCVLSYVSFMGNPNNLTCPPPLPSCRESCVCEDAAGSSECAASLRIGLDFFFYSFPQQI